MAVSSFVGRRPQSGHVPLVRRASFSGPLSIPNGKSNDKGKEEDVLVAAQRPRSASLRVSGTPKPKKSLPLGAHYQVERADPMHRSTHHLPTFSGLGMTALVDKWIVARGDGTTNLPFFYWLEEQEQADLAMPSVSYLKGQDGRNRFLFFVVNGKLLSIGANRAATQFSIENMGRLADARGLDWCIFVLSPDNVLFAGAYNRGIFHHSSFLAGKQVKSAGHICVVEGKLVGITPKSGHYKPGQDDLCAALRFFAERGVGLGSVDVWYPAYGEANPFRLNAKVFMGKNGKFEAKTTPRVPKTLLARGRPDPATEEMLKQALASQ